MSGSNGGNSRALSAEGVYVDQTYTEDEFGVPAVRIRLESRREDPVRLALRVALPKSETVERVGFHPEYDPDNWSIEDTQLNYETALSPGTERTTVYAVQDLASEKGSVLLDNLTIEEVIPIQADERDPETDATDTAGEASDVGPSSQQPSLQGPDDGPVAATASDERSSEAGHTEPTKPDAIPAPDTGGETAANSADRQPNDRSMGTGSTEDSIGQAPKASDQDESTTDQDAGLRAHSEERLVDELMRRLESGDLSTEALDTLRGQLGAPDAGSGAGIDRRVADLQRRVSDIEAFSTSMEAVHEQHGPPADVLSETKADVAEVATQVESLNERVEALDGQGEDIESRIGVLEAEIEDLQSTVSQLDERMETAASERADLESTVSDLSEWREQLVGSLTDIGGE